MADPETFIESTTVSDEICFRLFTATRSYLPSELATYLLYTLDDPQHDDEPVLDEKNWREVAELLNVKIPESPIETLDFSDNKNSPDSKATLTAKDSPERAVSPII